METSLAALDATSLGRSIMPRKTFTAGLIISCSAPEWHESGCPARLTFWLSQTGESPPITGLCWPPSASKQNEPWLRRTVPPALPSPSCLRRDSAGPDRARGSAKSPSPCWHANQRCIRAAERNYYDRVAAEESVPRHRRGTLSRG